MKNHSTTEHELIGPLEQRILDLEERITRLESEARGQIVSPGHTAAETNTGHLPAGA